jgi:hypothetical protein
MTDPNNVATIAGEEPPTPLPARGIPWALVAATSLVIGLVVAFYLWTASSPNVPFEFRGQKNDYYNLLILPSGRARRSCWTPVSTGAATTSILA